MSTFDQNTLKELEKLCRIECSKKEEADFLEKLTQIIQFIDLLKDVDTGANETPPHLLANIQKTKLRKDLSGINLSTKDFLKNSPDTVGDMIKIPPVISGGSHA